jgi:hypothetical protein
LGKNPYLQSLHFGRFLGDFRAISGRFLGDFLTKVGGAFLTKRLGTLLMTYVKDYELTEFFFQIFSSSSDVAQPQL